MKIAFLLYKGIVKILLYNDSDEKKEAIYLRSCLPEKAFYVAHAKIFVARISYLIYKSIDEVRREKNEGIACRYNEARKWHVGTMYYYKITAFIPLKKKKEKEN